MYQKRSMKQLRCSYSCFYQLGKKIYYQIQGNNGIIMLNCIAGHQLLAWKKSNIWS